MLDLRNNCRVRLYTSALRTDRFKASQQAYNNEVTVLLDKLCKTTHKHKAYDIAFFHCNVYTTLRTMLLWDRRFNKINCPQASFAEVKMLGGYSLPRDVNARATGRVSFWSSTHVIIHQKLEQVAELEPVRRSTSTILQSDDILKYWNEKRYLNWKDRLQNVTFDSIWNTQVLSAAAWRS